MQKKGAIAIFCMTVCGLELAVDFTAPALLALLAMTLPKSAFFDLCTAALLHEGAHFFAMLLTKRRPERLRLSAAGMELSLHEGVLCPLPQLAAILLAGSLANAAAAMLFAVKGLPDAAAANLALAMFNLLPYRAADGGTLLEALLESHFLEAKPRLPLLVMRLCCCLATAFLAALLIAARVQNPALWAMLLFVTADGLLT